MSLQAYTAITNENILIWKKMKNNVHREKNNYLQ